MFDPSLLARIRVKTTSSAVNGEPSCHFTFGRSSNRQIVGVGLLHFCASAPSSFRLLSRRTSGS